MREVEEEEEEGGGWGGGGAPGLPAPRESKSDSSAWTRWTDRTFDLDPGGLREEPVVKFHISVLPASSDLRRF
ncbi:hypothetical protein GN956_G2765 [Arapaima gigas]